MRLHSYVVEHDKGFAPNPFHGVCTLAACKPKIPKYAHAGEYVIGTGSKKRGMQGRLIYLMKISQIVTFDQYWADRRHLRKKPVMNGSRAQRYGDNIYHRDPITQEWIQEHSFHSQEGGHCDPDNLEVDTGTTENVLLGEWFIYWGEIAPTIPDNFPEFIHEGIGNHYVDDENRIAAFLKWATPLGELGVNGAPVEWKYPLPKRKKAESIQSVALSAPTA